MVQATFGTRPKIGISGDNLCGAGKIDYWEDYDKKKHTTPLVCTAAGWTADGVTVKPDTVNCI